jgi:hypothetical protein
MAAQAGFSEGLGLCIRPAKGEAGDGVLSDALLSAANRTSMIAFTHRR